MIIYRYFIYRNRALWIRSHKHDELLVAYIDCLATKDTISLYLLLFLLFRNSTLWFDFDYLTPHTVKRILLWLI